jgi:hypothetical protein
MRGTSVGTQNIFASKRARALLCAAGASLCAGCAHYFGDLDERPARAHSTPSGRSKRVDTDRAFAVNDEFDLVVSYRREAARSSIPASNQAEIVASGLPNIDCMIAGRARVLLVERQTLRAISIDVTSGYWSEGAAARTYPIAVGQRVIVFASPQGEVERVVFDRSMSVFATNMARSCFEYAPLWTPLRAWVGSSSRRRIGEEWFVCEEDQSSGGWRGESTIAGRYARLARVTEVEGARALLLQSWSDGPLLARQVIGRDRWERRRLTSDVRALVLRGTDAPWQRVESVIRAEYATPTPVEYHSVNGALPPPIPWEVFTLDDITARRAAELSRFTRAPR